MDVQVKIELGHRASPRSKPTKEGFTHDWTVYVRGPDQNNISHFVEKVVFFLHPSFEDPTRVCKEPPYHVSEKGYASFELPIKIHFRNKAEPRTIDFNYNLLLHMQEPVNHSRCEKLTFQNPTDEFKKKLIKAGGVVIRQPLRQPEEMQFTNLFGPPIKTTESPKKPKQPTVASKEKPSRLSLDESSSKQVSGKSKEKDSSLSKSSSSLLSKSDDGHVFKEKTHKEKHSSKDTSRKHMDSPLPSSSGKRYSESPTNHKQAKKLKRSSSSSSFPDKKPKEKDKELEREREKQKEIDREREREREKEAEKAAEKARKDAERERERLKEQERERQREIAKEREAARQKELEKERQRELAREKEREEKERERKELEKEKLKEKERERQRRKEKKEKERLNSKSEKPSKNRHSSAEKQKNRDKENMNESLSHKKKSPLAEMDFKKKEEVDEKPKMSAHSKTDSPSRGIKKEEGKRTEKSQSEKYYSKDKTSKESSKSVKSEKSSHKEKVKEQHVIKTLSNKGVKMKAESEPKPKMKKSDESITSYRNKLSNVTLPELINDLSGSDSSDSLSVSSISSSSVPGSDSGSDNDSEAESISSKSRKSSSSSKASTPAQKSALGFLIAELEEDESDDIPESGSVFSTQSSGSRHSPSRTQIESKPVFTNHSSGSRPSPNHLEDHKSVSSNNKSKLSPGQRYTKDKLVDLDRDEIIGKSPKKRARVSSKDKSSMVTNAMKYPGSGVLIHSESKGFDIDNRHEGSVSPGSQKSGIGIGDEAPQEMMDSQNGEDLTELVALQRKLMSIKDPNILVKVVMLIQKVGKFKIGESSTFDFDLCSLDSNTVQEIKTYIGQA